MKLIPGRDQANHVEFELEPSYFIMRNLKNEFVELSWSASSPYRSSDRQPQIAFFQGRRIPQIVANNHKVSSTLLSILLTFVFARVDALDDGVIHRQGSSRW